MVLLTTQYCLQHSTAYITVLLTTQIRLQHSTVLLDKAEVCFAVVQLSITTFTLLT